MAVRPPLEERIKRMEDTMPGVVDLARAVALSVRTEPELLRNLRFAMAPRAGAWTEADFYFSAFVAQRTPDWVVLAADYAEELRTQWTQRLNDDDRGKPAVAEIRAMIKRAHTSAPFEIQLEEELVWLAIDSGRDGAGVRRALDEKLHDTYTGRMLSAELGRRTARWFVSAARRLPALAKETEGFALLAFASSAILGGRTVDAKLRANEETFAELSKYLPESIEKRSVWVGVTTRGVHFLSHAAAGYREISVPRTNPVPLDVGVARGVRRLVHLERDGEAFVEHELGDVEIRTLSRDVYRLKVTRQSQGLTAPSFDTFHSMSFANDIFVSYARADIQWVTRFSSDLAETLRRRLGREVHIFRGGDELELGSNWNERLKSELRGSALFAAIVSPRFFDSQYCLQHLSEFTRIAEEQTGGVAVNGRSRVFPVKLSDVAPTNLPLSLQVVLGYEFFEAGITKGGPSVELNENSSRYNMLLDQLAEDIAPLLSGLATGPGVISWPPALSATDWDLVDRIDFIHQLSQMLSGQSKERIQFILGAAGSGKSHLLGRLRDYAGRVGIACTYVSMKEDVTLAEVISQVGLEHVNLFRHDSALEEAPAAFGDVERFMHGLRNLSSPFLLIIDNYEQCAQDLRNWIDRLLVEIERMPAVLIVIAGQQGPELGKQRWAEFVGRMTLGPIESPDDWLEYARKKKWPIGPGDLDTLTTATEATKGQPNLMANLLENIFFKDRGRETS